MKKKHPIAKQMDRELLALERIRNGQGTPQDKRIYAHLKNFFPTLK